MTRKIIPARDATPISSLLVYSRNGVGKTNLIASAAEIAPTLDIDCEKGTSSIRKSKAKVYKVTTYEEIEEIYWYLKTQKHPYKFVGIDPLTRLGQLAMNYVLREKVAQNLTDDPYTANKQDWGKCAELIRNVVLRFRELEGVFLIISCYERRRETDDEDSDYDYIIGPDAQPAVKGFLMGQMDLVGRLYVKQVGEEEEAKVERRILFGPHEIYESKDRSGNLQRVMRRPTMKRILDLVNKEIEG